MGTSVSLYQNTIAAGGPNDSSSIGATWVFVMSGTNWSQQGSKIIATGYSGTPSQGTSVSVYENTLVIGGPGNTTAGAIWIYLLNSGAWTQTQMLTGTGSTGASQQGTSVSIYSNYIAVGGPNNSTNIGASWIYYNNTAIFTDYNNVLINTVNNIVPQSHGSRHSLGGNDVLALTNDKLWIGNASNQIAEQTMSGDGTISNTGVFTLSAPSTSVT
jgi:hypothetical protein